MAEYEPYEKHQLYPDGYPQDSFTTQQIGVIHPPKQCYWQVLRHLGGGKFTKDSKEGQIALILNEDRTWELTPRDWGYGSGFWSVISFLTVSEARNLIKELQNAL